MAGGLGMHHAGMLRSDRNLVERLFRDGVIKVRCLPSPFHTLHPRCSTTLVLGKSHSHLLDA